MRAIAKQQARARYTMRARKEDTREENRGFSRWGGRAILSCPQLKWTPPCIRLLERCLKIFASGHVLIPLDFNIFEISQYIESPMIIAEARPNKVFLSDPSPRSRMRVAPFYFNAWYIKEKVYGPQGRASSRILAKRPWEKNVERQLPLDTGPFIFSR